VKVDPQEIRQSKRRAFNDLLNAGRIYLTLDTRVAGVKVPSEHQGKAALTLLFGLDLPLALEDLFIDDMRIAVTLSFSRCQHHCVIPWDAVWYIVPKGEKKGVIFEPSLPPEARRQIQQQGSELKPLDLGSYLDEKKTSSKDLLVEQEAHRQETERREARSRFQVIDGDGVPANSSTSLTTEEHNDEKESSSPRDRRPTLVLIKNDEDEDGEE
jgi:stringent starvation protein B